jgi:uncharacterized protein YpiB (UPF0302 family)
MRLTKFVVHIARHSQTVLMARVYAHRVSFKFMPHSMKVFDYSSSYSPLQSGLDDKTKSRLSTL